MQSNNRYLIKNEAETFYDTPEEEEKRINYRKTRVFSEEPHRQITAMLCDDSSNVWVIADDRSLTLIRDKTGARKIVFNYFPLCYFFDPSTQNIYVGCTKNVIISARCDTIVSSNEYN